ncbi:NAD(P)-binding protein [Coniophora puteana RWD-64-598 SS2]|uniref:NAD(P)-binding protein n=1 Tax=Coniophora puteana (strain RWD-64-598) TaxID=741705 RepID=A0A5M3MUI1_CONPW|nr:NAD(P)-binding protein [Coniophora puteana RWD-64-598 SS2]EIW82789.1 NAD(P)-binding protein [Coniophora puteana RWD-64-598 SS2]
MRGRVSASLSFAELLCEPLIILQVAVVTGATVGIGFEVSKALALAKARVLLLSRKAEHGDDAISKIKEEAPDADVHFIECDLGNLRNVKDVGDRICAEQKRLDIVIADAGVGVNRFGLSSDNIDRHFAVNHLGHFLLINRLLPLVRKTSKTQDSGAPGPVHPRIVTVSSELYKAAPSDTAFASEDEVSEAGSASLSAIALYGRSKLANILFTRYTLVERAIRPTGDAIYALAVHPGAVHTGQQDQFKEAYGALFGTVAKAVSVPFMRNPEQGSLCALWAATSDAIDKNVQQGYYFTDPGVPGQLNSQADDEKLGENLYHLSERLVREKLGPDALNSWT